MVPDKSPDARGATSARLLNSRYEVGEKIGDGSFFAVYRGRDTQSGRAVAIKIVSDDFAGDREFAERLRAESLAAVKLDHPHIVAVYDAWMEGGRVAIATEFVRGIDLKERVRRVAPFPLAVAVDIAAAVSEALEYAASQGIAHGDLRPENILVTPEGQVKLADFGIGAAVCASSRLQMSALIHSAHYLPPEVAQGKAPSPPSDVYSLGAILFEMLSGQPPFQADTPFAIAVKHLHDPPPPLRRQNPGVPKAVEGIVLKCLQKEPAARYPNPGALLADLRGVREALRFGKPLTWSPAPEPTAPAAGRGPDAASRSAVPPPPAKAPDPPRVTPAARGSEGTFGEPSVRLLLLLPLMALVLGGAVFAVIVLGTRSPRDTTVPDILNMTQSEAKRQLAARHLLLRVVKESYDESKPPGTITMSDPPQGIQMKEGKPVDVWISKGPRPSVVPNLLSLTEADARDRLREANLSVGELQREYDEIVPQGQVISQEPAAQTQVARHSEVRLVVSKGPEPEPPPEPATAPEPAPTPAPDTTSTGGGFIGGGSTDNTTPGGTGAGNGTMTDPSSPGASATDSTQGAPSTPVNKNRTFDISTPMVGDRPRDRLRIVVTDDQGRRQVASELHPRGETVRKTIHATGMPGTIRIEVYENRQLVKDQQY